MSRRIVCSYKNKKKYVFFRHVLSAPHSGGSRVHLKKRKVYKMLLSLSCLVTLNQTKVVQTNKSAAVSSAAAGPDEHLTEVTEHYKKRKG